MSTTSTTGTDRRHWPPTDDVPERLGRYELAYQLGHGGCAAVFAGFDPKLRRVVAIKVFGERTPIDDIEREGSALALVVHPNVVAIHDMGQADGFAFLVMDLAAGTLVKYMKRRHDWREIVGVFVQLGRGVAAVHAAGLAHGDIKPSNILFDSTGRPMLADFGLASASSDTSERPHGGSLNYMAPERLDGSFPDGASDQFSFCVTLWEVLHGVRPWPSNLSEAVAERPPKRGKTRLPASLDRVLLRGLAVEPRLRFESMGVLVDALIDIMTETGRQRACWRSVALALAGFALAGVLDRCT